MRRNGWKRDGENDEVGEDEAVDEGRSPNADELTAGDLATVLATESDSGNGTAADAASFANNDDDDNAAAGFATGRRDRPRKRRL